MSFTPHNYRTGDLIEAAPFNELEAQVALNEQNIDTKLDADNPTVTGDLTVAGAGSFGDEVIVGNNESVPVKITNQAILDETGQTIITKLLAIKTAIENGIYGKDGVSPTITITDITGGHRITITDKMHPSGQNIDILDGADGYSPAVTITEIEGGHTVKITDETHPSGQTFNVMDGDTAYVISLTSTQGYELDYNGETTMNAEQKAVIALHPKFITIKNGWYDLESVCVLTEHEFPLGTEFEYTKYNNYASGIEKFTFNTITEKISYTFTVRTRIVDTNTSTDLTWSSSKIRNELNGKVNTILGKGLSTNDYTTYEKNKLEGIEAQANKTVVDNAMSSTSENPVQNKVINGELMSLNQAIDSIESCFDNPNVLSGLEDRTGLAVANGKVTDAGSNDAHCIQFDVEPNTQYRLVMPIANRSGFTANNTGIFEVGQTYTGFSASITYTNSYVFTTPANVTSVLLYFYAGTYTFKRSDFALYKGATIPDDLTVRLKQANLPKQIPYTSVFGVEVKKEETDFIEKIEGVNRFNKEEATSGVMLNANGTITTLSSQAYAVSGYVPVEEETGYAIYGTSSIAGQYSTDVYVTVQMYDATKTRIGNAVGTMASGYYTVTTLANTAFVRVNIFNSLDVFMIVKGSTYPATYIPFSDKYVLVGVEVSSSGHEDNPLYGKTILWNGDSICAGKAFNDTDDAWAGRIAEANNMTYKNYAVSGGTITENVQQGGVTKHSVCATLATMYAEHPNADYIVFDGGCNDADLLGSMIGGNTPERLGTFSLSDFSGDYDEDTFCGAFESILYRMTNYWRDAKFAYIIPHKMGILNEYRTDYTKEHHNYRAYYDLAIQMCEKWGVQYLDLWDGCFFCPMIAHLCDTYSTMTQQEIYDAGMVYADRQHLTQKGYDLEAQMIENWLKTI